MKWSIDLTTRLRIQHCVMCVREILYFFCHLFFYCLFEKKNSRWVYEDFERLNVFLWEQNYEKFSMNIFLLRRRIRYKKLRIHAKNFGIGNARIWFLFLNLASIFFTKCICNIISTLPLLLITFLIINLYFLILNGSNNSSKLFTLS